VYAVDDAVRAGRAADAAFYAGGTTLVDLMKLAVMTPASLVDINHLPLTAIEETNRGLRIGALARMSDVARDPRVAELAPAVALALEQSASGQLRNMATIGGNLLQRTRCAYFRDAATACNKRRPGSGCGARAGINEDHAILGTSAACIAVHASDLAVTLAAFDATVHAHGAHGPRAIPAAAFFRRPGETPERETTLEPGDLIVAVELPRSRAAARSTYVKVRDRASYAFALASCAAGVELAADGTIADVRVALGGVATIPWRAHAGEAVLRGARPDAETFAAAARAEFAAAQPTVQNAFKIELGMHTMVRALEAVTA
jgi:xanthine dehydrogenase YagS FAD-binding subunit